MGNSKPLRAAKRGGRAPFPIVTSDSCSEGAYLIPTAATEAELAEISRRYGAGEDKVAVLADVLGRRSVKVHFDTSAGPKGPPKGSAGRQPKRTQEGR